MPTREQRPRGHLESEVVACLAGARVPLTAREVLDRLDQPLACTTVLTTLVRLHGKGALKRTPRGRAYAYELEGGRAGARAGMTAQQMQRLLDGVDDRDGVLMRFVAGLDAKSERVLRELLAGSESPKSNVEDRPARRRRR